MNSCGNAIEVTEDSKAVWGGTPCGTVMLPFYTQGRLPETEQQAPGSLISTSQGVRFSQPGPRALILQALSPEYAGTEPALGTMETSFSHVPL